MSNKRSKSELEIFDADGEIVYRAYVDDPSQGLRGATLEGFAAPFGQLQGLDFSNAKLYWAILTNADLSFANLSETDLRGSSLDGAICKYTNFSGANLGRDNLGGQTSLKGTDLSTANLNGTHLIDAVYDNKTLFPPGFSPEDRGMVRHIS